MPVLKTYEPLPNYHWSHSKNHTLVRSAYKKGLTGIKITRLSTDNGAAGGWVLECDQIKRLHLGFDVIEANKRIDLIEPVK
jgi:hypothetical protein